MRLLSLSVRNYRVHEHVSVEFAAGHTVVAGPNEAGKSTLIAAMSDVLFMHHRSAGQKLEAMKSRRGGHPEVELRFEAEGGTYTLKKTFRGSSGSCELVDASRGQRWSSDDAEVQLRRFSGAEAKGRSQIDSRWEHLWVLQGKAAEDFVATANLQQLQDALAARADEAGVSTLTQQDDRLLAEVHKLVDAHFGKQGKLLTSSPVSASEKKFRELQDRLNQARAVRDARRGVQQHLTSLKESIERHVLSLDESRPQLAAMDLDLAALEAQVRDLDAVNAEHQKAGEQLAQATREVQEDVERRVRLDELRQEQAKHQKVLEQIVRDEASHKELRKALQAEVRDADAGEQRLVRECELAAALEQRGRGSEAEAELIEAANAYREAKEELAAGETELAEAQAVSDADVQSLEKLETNQGLAEARLAAVAARLTRVGGEGRVLVDGAELRVGEELRVDAVVRIELPDGNVLQVEPGGQDLGELRRAFLAAQQALRDGLQKLGVLDVAAARTLRDRWAKLAKARDLKQGRLQAMSDPGPKLAQHRGSMEAFDATIAKLREAGVQLAEGQTAEALGQELEKCRAQREAVRQQLDSAEADVQAAHEQREEARKTEAELAGNERELSTLVEDFAQRRGEPEAQTAWIERLDRSCRDLEARLADLQPASESLVRKRQDRETLAKAVKSSEDMLERDRGESQRLQGQLDASQGDLQEDVERLEEELGLADAVYQRAWQRAQGDRLLADKLTELQAEQQNLREAPLTDAIRRYLGTAFGAASNVVLGQKSGGGRTLALVDRSAAGLGAFRFDELSHGARELVGLAVRLAMAEVMAAEQPDGCMPLVLDDAVTNVDPDRLPQVGFMIGQATQRGVQVVLATCETKRTSVFLAERVHVLERVAQGSGRAAPQADVQAPQSRGDGAEAFLDALRALGGAASTRQLRRELGWDTDRFESVRHALEAQGVIRRPEGSRSVEIVDRGDEAG